MRRELDMMDDEQKAKDEERKKFEVLQVLNLLEQTEIKSRDLFQKKKDDDFDEKMQVQFDLSRQMTQVSAIGDAIRKVDSDRLLLS